MKNKLDEKVKDYIEDYVEVRVQAKYQTNEEMIGALMRKLDEHLSLSSSRYETIMNEIHKVAEAGKPVEKWFDNINFMKSAIMWILVFLGAVAGLYLSFKGIVKDFLHNL